MNTILTDDERRAVLTDIDPETKRLPIGFKRYAEAIEAAVLAKLRERAAVMPQWHKVGCADWYDGYPDHEDGGGPYETRTLYAAPLPAVVQVPQGIDVEDLRDRLMSISSAVADDDHRAAQSMIGETLRMLAAAPEAPAQPSVPAPWREAVKVARGTWEELLDAQRALKAAEGGPWVRKNVPREVHARLHNAWQAHHIALAQLDSLEGGE